MPTGLPLLLQHVLQHAPALPAAGSTAVQAWALRGQLEGMRAAPPKWRNEPYGWTSAKRALKQSGG